VKKAREDTVRGADVRFIRFIREEIREDIGLLEKT
jgi:hypothetical protein